MVSVASTTLLSSADRRRLARPRRRLSPRLAYITAIYSAQIRQTRKGIRIVATIWHGAGVESATQLVASIARTQHGVFTRAQALTAGIRNRTIDSRVANGTYERLHPHVLGIPGAADTWHRQVVAAALSAGPLSAASHRTAAYLWDLTSFRPETVEVTSRRHKRVHRKEFIVRESLDLIGPDVVILDGIPVTTAERTVVDLGASAPLGVVARCLDTGLRTKLFSLADIDHFIARVAKSGRTGVGIIRPLIEERLAWQTVTESTLEDLFRSVIVRSGLPMPEPQFELYTDDGKFVGRFDFVLHRQKVLIELDSERWHMDPESFRRDRDKQNRAHAAGWTVYRFTWHQLRQEPDRVIDTLAYITAIYGAQIR